MDIVKINRHIIIEIYDEVQTGDYSFNKDLEYRKFLLVTGRIDSLVMRDLFLQLRGRGLLNVDKLMAL